MTRAGRRALLVAASLLVAPGCGSREDVSARNPDRPPSTQAGPSEPTTTVARSSPRWETVTTFTGTGSADQPAFTILADSIQWRVRWTCETERLRITTDPPPRRPKPLVDVACPGTGEAFGIVSGAVRLTIDAIGPWRLMVDQQVDTPLREPPFEGMDTAPVLRQGTFYPVEKTAKGTARLYQRADGSAVLRLEEFEVTSNVDLFVWLSEAVAPKTSAEAVGAPHEALGNLRSTLGNQSYVIPPDIPIDRVRSIVVWCEPLRIAYGAVALA